MRKGHTWNAKRWQKLSDLGAMLLEPLDPAEMRQVPSDGGEIECQDKVMPQPHFISDTSELQVRFYMNKSQLLKDLVTKDSNLIPYRPKPGDE